MTTLCSRAMAISLLVAFFFASPKALAQLNGENEVGCAGGSAPLYVDGVFAGCYEPQIPILTPNVTLPSAPQHIEGGQGRPPSNYMSEDLTPGIDNGLQGDGTGVMCGNPMDVLTQNKLQAEVDFVGPGSLPLRIVRYYNSHGANIDGY